MKLKLIMLSLTTALISFTSSAQVKIDSNIKWSENIDREGSKCELIIDENKVLTKLYYNTGYLKVQKIDAENKVKVEKDFHFRNFTKGSSHTIIIRTDNFINLISRYKNREKEIFVHRLSRINLTTLEVEAHSQELFIQDDIPKKNVPDITFCVSPDKSKFFIGHHNYSSKYIPGGTYYYAFVGTVYNAQGDKLHSGKVELDRKTYVREQRATPQITNEGVAFFRHEFKNKVFQLSPYSNEIEECPISDEIRKFNPSFNRINNIKVFNGDKNYVCFTYSEHEDRRFRTGMVICELTKNDDFKILKQMRFPPDILKTISKTEYESSRDCIRETEGGQKQLFYWKVSDFEKLDDLNVIILEYNHTSSSYGPPSPSRGATIRQGEIIVFKFNSNFTEYDYHIIPKLFTGECYADNCEGLLSTANPNGYSLFNFNSKIMLFYWGNSKNEIHTTSNTTEKREIFHVPTNMLNEEKACMYRVDISSKAEPLLFYNMGSYMSAKYPLLLNQGVRLEENIYFRAQKKTSSNDHFKVARYTF